MLGHIRCRSHLCMLLPLGGSFPCWSLSWSHGSLPEHVAGKQGKRLAVSLQVSTGRWARQQSLERCLCCVSHRATSRVQQLRGSGLSVTHLILGDLFQGHLEPRTAWIGAEPTQQLEGPAGHLNHSLTVALELSGCGCGMQR